MDVTCNTTSEVNNNHSTICAFHNWDSGTFILFEPYRSVFG